MEETKIIKIKKVKKLVKKVSEEEKEKEKEKDLFSEKGPIMLPNVLDITKILMSFFIVNHKYIGLQISDNGKIMPTFFIVLADWNEENTLLCRFVKHNHTTNGDGKVSVKPLWDQPWKDATIENNVLHNCMPFDEVRDYTYDPTISS